MIVIYNNLIPFKGFIAINLFGVVFARKEYKDKLDQYNTLEHEAIHTMQMRELLYIGFYLWYFIEWLLKLPKYGKAAYYHISFEREAFRHQEVYPWYRTARKPFNWRKYL